MATNDTTPAEQFGSGRGLSLNRVRKNIHTAGTIQGACASSRQPVIPPAPLTGDVGRGCGDASRALLFVFSKRKLLPPRRRISQQKSGGPCSPPDSFHVIAIASCSHHSLGYSWRTIA